jgi:hypothetical protein
MTFHRVQKNTCKKKLRGEERTSRRPSKKETYADLSVATGAIRARSLLPKELHPAVAVTKATS